MNKSKSYTPPVTLVKTWLQVLRSDVDEEAILHVKNMLVRNFGSVDLAVMYLEQQSIRLRA